MTTLWARRIGLTLIPDGDESLSEFEKLPLNASLRVEVKQPRSGPRHRLYWALCHRIAIALGAEPENVSDILKIASGHYTSVKTQSYGEVRLPKSIAFHNLDEQGFKDFLDRCIQVIENEWGIARPDIKDAIKDLLKEHQT